MSSLISRGPVLAILAAVAVAVAGLWTCWRLLVAVPEGDALFRQGEVHLSSGEFSEATVRRCIERLLTRKAL